MHSKGDPFVEFLLGYSRDGSLEQEEDNDPASVQSSMNRMEKKLFNSRESLPKPLSEEKNEASSSDGEESNDDNKNYEWRTEQYWALPENVRKAIDRAKKKKKRSDFFYKLLMLNEKIHIFTHVFYNKMPKF